MPEIRHSVCALDCPDCCSLVVRVENGTATKLGGDPTHPVTRGFLCGKVAQYLEREYHPERLLYPQRRIGAKGEGRFERISWDEALDEIATRLESISREFGPEAILPYSYGELSLKENDSNPPLTLPSNSLLFRAQGLQVGVVRPDGTVELRSVQVGRDFGQSIEILGGVTPADRVIINPTDSLVSGIKVRIQATPSAMAAK